MSCLLPSTSPLCLHQWQQNKTKCFLSQKGNLFLRKKIVFKGLTFCFCYLIRFKKYNSIKILYANRCQQSKLLLPVIKVGNQYLLEMSYLKTEWKTTNTFSLMLL